MKRFIAVLLSTFLLLCAVPVLADTASVSEWAKTEADKLAEDQRVVNVFTWTYYIPDEVIADFEAATGIRVNYSPFLDNEDVMAKLQSNPGQYDIVVCSDYVIFELAKNGLLAEIDQKAIPNYVNIDPAYQAQYFDPQNLYAIAYTNTVPLIVYNPDKIDFEVTGLADLWREEFKSNLSIIAELRSVIGMAEKKLGLSLNEKDPEKLALALEELKALKPNIVTMNEDTPHNALVYGDAIAGYMYGSQIVEARKALPQLKVVYPKEGLTFGIDCLVVPNGAPHMDATNIFLNYLLDGEVSAYASSLINYGNCNTAAQAFMTEEFKADDTVNVPEEALATAEMIMPLENDVLDTYTAVWTEFMK